MQAKDIIVGAIYRHFKGGYYLVTSVARNEADEKPTVVYQSVENIGQVWTRPVESFIQRVDTESPDNVTKQKHRFEPVFDFDLIEKSYTTQRLVAELLMREDNPFKDTIIRPETVVDTFYDVGMMRYSADVQRDFFEPACSGFSSAQEARDWLNSHYSPLYIIVRRLILREEYLGI